MIEREYFDQLGITDGVPENILTYDDVFRLVESQATLPYEGEWSVRALQEKFRGTYVETVLQSFPEGEAIALADLDERLDSPLNEDGAIYVDKRRVELLTNDCFMTDNKLHLDWQARATAYRLAADQVAQHLPVTDFDTLPVCFTSRVSNPYEFMLFEHRSDEIRDLSFRLEGNELQAQTYDFGGMQIIAPLNDKHLRIETRQYRLIEYTDQEAWHMRGALTFLEVYEEVSVPWDSDEAMEEGPFKIVRGARTLVDTTIPSEFFDWKIKRGPEGATVHIQRFIYTALPPDLVLPDPLPLDAYEDLPYKDNMESEQ